MSQPVFDDGKFRQFLSANAPQVEGSPSLELFDSPEAMAAKYFLTLHVTADGDELYLPISPNLTVANVFPPDHRMFTVEELGSLADDETLDEGYIERVEKVLGYFKINLSWLPDSITLSDLEDRSDLNGVECRLGVSATLSRQAGHGQSRHTVFPYSAETDYAVAIASFLSSKQLDEAWASCWQQKVNFREFF